jgi:hypothetical protein
MEKDFNRILDECIDRANRGESLQDILKDYPEYTGELEPLLITMVETKSAYSYTPSDDAKRAGRQRLYAVLDQRQQPSFWQRILAQRTVWATVATVLVIAIAGYFGLRPVIAPVAIPTETISASNPEGNFAFLVSDEVNAIADFNNLYVTIDKVSLLKDDQQDKWMEFVPDIRTFDLALLPGEVTQELWQGDIPEGKYSQVVIYVSQVTGTLKSTGETLEVKLPSNKLQLSSPFNISTGNITSFTYDITVINTGKAKEGQKYLLKPQASESGASQEPASNPGKNQDNPGKSQDNSNKGQDNSPDKSNGKNPIPTPDTTVSSSVINNRKQ